MKTPLPPKDALDALFAAARAERPDTSRAEYGFETRLRARLAAEKPERYDWTEFAAWCWRLMPALAVITLAACFWALWPSAAGEPSLTTAIQGDDLTAWLADGWPSPI